MITEWSVPPLLLLPIFPVSSIHIHILLSEEIASKSKHRPYSRKFPTVLTLTRKRKGKRDRQKDSLRSNCYHSVALKTLIRSDGTGTKALPYVSLITPSRYEEPPDGFYHASPCMQLTSKSLPPSSSYSSAQICDTVETFVQSGSYTAVKTNAAG